MKKEKVPAPASVAGSCRSRSPAGKSMKTAKSPSDKLLASIAKHRDCLTLRRVLSEELHQDMHQARRALEAIATKDSLSAEWVGFQSFMNERELALSLSVDNLHKIPRAQRQEKIGEFFCFILGTEEPPQTWCVAMLGCHVRDCLEDLVSGGGVLRRHGSETYVRTRIGSRLQTLESRV